MKYEFIEWDLLPCFSDRVLLMMITRVLLLRRSSMSSIEEENESDLSNELVIQTKQSQSTCVLQWDSEQDFDDDHSIPTVSESLRRTYVCSIEIWNIE